MPSLAAVLWLLGLLAAAPSIRTSARYEFVDRLRDALILGVAIPLVLGALHLLYPVALWLVLFACYLVSPRAPLAPPRAGRGRHLTNTPYLLIAALAITAWPQLIRPLLDGDSVSYHLPNAAMWVHSHSLWSVDARYWWYPPASELFASAIYALAGPFAVGWAGFAALALIGFRIVAWTRKDFGTHPLVADGIAAATIAAAPLALQAGTLQNDVWLAAFLLESLWLLRARERAGYASVAITALIKPFGWIFALLSLAVTRAPWRYWLAGIAAIALWVAHDAALWKYALVPPASTSTANTFATTILAHGFPAIWLLIRVLFTWSPFALLALVVAALGPLADRSHKRVLGWSGIAAVALLLCMPLAYSDALPQLENGGSLRFAIPAIALGAVLFARYLGTLPLAAAFALPLAALLFGAIRTLALFWNDAPTRTALGVAILAVALVAVGKRLGQNWPAVAGAAIAIAVATFLAGRHAVDYYTDDLQVSGKPSGVYRWIATQRPPSVGGWGLRAGVVNVLDPQARAIDLPDDAACATAHARGTLLIAVAESTREPAFNAARLEAARHCGSIVYDDGIAVVSH